MDGHDIATMTASTVDGSLPQDDSSEAVDRLGAVRLGRVVSVSGSQVVALLDDPNMDDIAAGAPSLQMGAMIKMFTMHSIVYGLVGGLSIPIPAQDSQEREMKIVELELLGEQTTLPDGTLGPFQRGVSMFPSLGDDVYASTHQDLAQVYAQGGGAEVRIGTIHQDRSVPAYLQVDDLLGKHFAVLGTTGSGKSCAVALILHAILDHHPNGHVLLLDPHNEYASAFGDSAEVIGTDTLQLPYWLFNFEEFVEIMFGAKASERESEVAILNEIIVRAKQQFLGAAGKTTLISVDTPVPYQMGELNRQLEDAMGKLDKAENSVPFLRLKSRLNALQADPRFAFMFPGFALRDNMSTVISRLFRVPVDGKPIAILDLSGVPSEVINVVVSMVARMTFDFALWSDRSIPMLLVCEEAHRYMPPSDIQFPVARLRTRSKFLVIVQGFWSAGC